MGNDQPVAFSVECIPPGAGNPVPQELRSSVTYPVWGIFGDRDSYGFAASILFHKIEKSCCSYAEPHGAAFLADYVLSVFRSAGFNHHYHP